MLRCCSPRSILSCHVNFCRSQAWLAAANCRHVPQLQRLSTSTSKLAQDNGPDDDIDIDIETDLDHVSASGSGASGPVLSPTLPAPSKTFHHDLPSFLSYAQRSGLSKTSTVYKGTYYEYLTILMLRRYGFHLVSVGGAGDKGIDLVGTWTVPSSVETGSKTVVEKKDRNEGSCTSEASRTQILRVLVQCKWLSKSSKMGPNLVRELEGAVSGNNVPVGWRGPGVLGFLVSTRSATKGVRDAMAGTRRAMGFAMLEVEEPETREGMESVEETEETADPEADVFQAGMHVGTVRQMLWNKAASSLGLEGLEVVTRYDGNANKTGFDERQAMNKEVALMWQGKVLTGLNERSCE